MPTDPQQPTGVDPQLLRAREHLADDAVGTADKARALLAGRPGDQALLYGVAATLIDAADIARRPELADEGVRLLRSLPESVTDYIAYNLANGLQIAADLRYPKSPAGRLQGWEPRREARGLLRVAGRDVRLPAGDRSQALCNLGNLLDSSGRWLEAHEAYREALDLDPTNAMASGNAAIALFYVARRPVSGRPRILALSDRLLRHAREHPEEVLARADQRAVAHFGSYVYSNVPQPDHEFQPADDYARFVVCHRLALTFTVEGLASGAPLDEAHVHAPAAHPLANALLEQLGADYLKIRAMAYEALTVLPGEAAATLAAGDRAKPGSKEVDRPSAGRGWYRLEDGALVGDAVSALVLAQRTAIDILDRIAVAANLVLGIGDRPDKINFRKFWFEADSKNKSQPDLGRLREKLLVSPEPWLAAAMAELAVDMGRSGLYSHTQDLRNAATHRFLVVHETAPDPNLPDGDRAMERVALDPYARGVVEALQVTRAALLYLMMLLTPSATPLPTSDGSATA